MKRGLLILLGILIVAVGALVYEVLWAPNTFEGDRFVTVSKGDSYSQVVTALIDADIIRNRLLFDIAGRMLDLTTKMQIGKYRFVSGMSNKDVLEDLRYGKTIEFITVVIPEGLTAFRHAKIFSRTLGIDSTRYISLVNDSLFAQSLNIFTQSLEGYLMPSTYKLYWQADEESIIKEQVKQFWSVFDDSLRLEAERMGKSLNDILTIASIVEKETAVDSERALIAGVYYNRLQKRMRLQADPTVQYILEDGPRRLHYSDLQRESEYNTYLHYGLPPGPISNPGKAAILAAIYPEKNKFLFFVANGLGGHTFSRTYQEHQKAVKQFRKSRELQEAVKQEG